MTPQEERRAKELSANVAALSGGRLYSIPKQKKAKKKEYSSLLPDFLQSSKPKKEDGVQKEPVLRRITVDSNRKMTVQDFVDKLPIVPEKEILYESAETLASKLNSLPESLGQHVIKDFPKPEDIVPLVIEALKSLKGNDRLDISHIRNGEQLSRIAQREINMNDMRWHGAGTGATGVVISGLIGVDLFTTTSGQTSFVAANTPLSTIGLWISGALQTPTTDYTVSGTTATLTALTWPNGTPPSQPVVWVTIHS